MNRAAARAAVATAIQGAGFDLIVQGAPETFNGKAKVAVITSAGTERVLLARGPTSEDINSIVVSIYVQRAANGGSSVEDSLDSLTAATIAAIDALDTSITFARSDAGAAGAPNRRVDGLMFRVERIGFTILEEGV
jgi:hypothetical protein